MNWRKRIYSSYVSTHNTYSVETADVTSMEKHFPTFSAHYGKFLPSNKNAKILEIGCGNGAMLLWLSRIGYSNASGVDISPEQVQLAKKLGLKNVVEGDASVFLENKKECYDVVIARDVIEHFSPEDSFHIIEKMYLGLRPGGELIMQTPNAESPFGSRYRYYDFTHGISYTSNSIGQVLGALGSRHFFARPARPVVHGILSLIRYTLWRVIEILLSTYLIIETGSARAILTQNMIVIAEKPK